MSFPEAGQPRRVDYARIAYTRALHDLAAFLDAHPTVPVPKAITVDLVAQNDLDGAEAVARAAHAMGVRAHATPNGTERAEKHFGPVTFAVTFHPTTPRGGV